MLWSSTRKRTSPVLLSVHFQFQLLYLATFAGLSLLFPLPCAYQTSFSHLPPIFLSHAFWNFKRQNLCNYISCYLNHTFIAIASLAAVFTWLQIHLPSVLCFPVWSASEFCTYHVPLSGFACEAYRKRNSSSLLSAGLLAIATKTMINYHNLRKCFKKVYSWQCKISLHLWVSEQKEADICLFNKDIQSVELQSTTRKP